MEWNIIFLRGALWRSGEYLSSNRYVLRRDKNRRYVIETQLSLFFLAKRYVKSVSRVEKSRDEDSR